MQYSKGQKREYSQAHIIKKLQKIQEDISSADDYIRLEKCLAKLEKIRQSVAEHSDKKMKKQLKAMTDVCERLIKQKTKYFKKKVLQQLSNQKNHQNNQFSKQNTLKYSKSVENFQMLPLSKQQPRSKINKNQEQQLWGDRTQIQGRNQKKLQEQVENLGQELKMYKGKVALLEKPQNLLSLRLGQHQAIFEQDISLKLKQRGLQIEQLKGKLKYYEQTNQQLRNRLLNEQKRQQDYTSNLKAHISRLTQEIELLGRDNKKLQDQLTREVQKNTDLQVEMAHLTQQSQYFQREKKQRQQSQIFKMKDSRIRKELETLSQQEKYMREMDCMLQNQKQEKQLLNQQIEQIQKKEQSLLEEISILEKQKERTGDILQINNEQLQSLKKELSLTLEFNRRTQEQLIITKADAMKMEYQLEKDRVKRGLQLRKKAEHLKQIKELIQGK